MWTGTITVITENTVYENKKMIAEEGLSVLLQSASNPTKAILFDTGRRWTTLMHNLQVAGIDISTIRTVVLSHGHAGHIGAIHDGVTNLRNPQLVMHPSIFLTKAKKQDGNLRLVRKMLDREHLQQHARVTITDQMLQVEAGLWTSGEIPLVNHEDFGDKDKQRHWVEKEKGFEIDYFQEEISLYVETARGILVVMGCGHRGVTNILKSAGKVFPDRPILGIIGGFHLMDRPETTQAIISSLRTIGVKYLLPCHCTGFTGRRDLSMAFPEAFHLVATGTKLIIDEAIVTEP